mmetsp:Transcript_24448/g.56682  ORF Transcript_24448/g.56682 Transcript_24448/m.56682 type:complete len:198 (-) Transcript_24448:253-846(-)
MSSIQEDVVRLQSLSGRLKKWLLSEEGFGHYLDDFFRANSQYFDDYQEEHALHYTTLHKEFVAKLELEIQGWLADEGLADDDLESILQVAKDGAAGEEEGADETDLVEMMLEAMEYQKWISSIFALKRRIRERRKVRVRKAPPPPPPPTGDGTTVEVVVPEGAQPGETVRIEHDGNEYSFIIPPGFEQGMTFQAAVG